MRARGHGPWALAVPLSLSLLCAGPAAGQGGASPGQREGRCGDGRIGWRPITVQGACAPCMPGRRCPCQQLTRFISEVCDGRALGGQTCRSLGYVGGRLACAPTCAAFDVSGCRACPQRAGLTCLPTPPLPDLVPALGHLLAGAESGGLAGVAWRGQQADHFARLTAEGDVIDHQPLSSGPLAGNGTVQVVGTATGWLVARTWPSDGEITWVPRRGPAGPPLKIGGSSAPVWVRWPGDRWGVRETGSTPPRLVAVVDGQGQASEAPPGAPERVQAPAAPAVFPAPVGPGVAIVVGGTTLHLAMPTAGVAERLVLARHPTDRPPRPAERARPTP